MAMASPSASLVPASTAVCLCLSPLHVLTVAAIARQEGLRFSRGWYVCSADSPKDRHYAKRLEDCCDEVVYQVVPSDQDDMRWKHAAIALRRYRFIAGLRRRQSHAIGQCFVPSSMSHYVYAFASALRWQQLCTFDDGWLNVQPDSVLSQCLTRASTKAFYRVSGIRFWPERIHAASARHFTLYALPNYSARCEAVSLMRTAGSISGTGNCGGPARRFFIGPAPECSLDVRARIQSYLDAHPVDGIFGHPRDLQQSFLGAPYVDTPLIVEDYVMQLCAADTDLHIELIGYETSVLLNLAGLARIKVVSIMPDDSVHATTVALMRAGGVYFADAVR